MKKERDFVPLIAFAEADRLQAEAERTQQPVAFLVAYAVREGQPHDLTIHKKRQTPHAR